MILYIAKRGNNNIAAVNHLKVIKELNGESNVFVVDLLNPLKENRERYVSFAYNSYSLIRLLRWLQGNVCFIGNSEIEIIINIIKQYNIKSVFMEESDLGNLVAAIKKYDSDIKIIGFFHDISADLFLQRRKSAPFWRLHEKIECTITIKQENVCAKIIDEIWVFNEADADRLYRYHSRKPNAIIPLSDSTKIEYSDYENIRSSNTKKILFVCSTYKVNIRGFLWFYKKVFPQLIGDFEILVIGSGSTKLEKYINETSKIKIIGRVESVEEYYIDSDLVIIPVFEGGGMKLKSLEALAYGKYTVSTAESLHGYWEKIPDSLKNKIVFQCDTESGWIEILNDLIKSDIRKINPEILECYKEHFSYDRMKNEFSNHLF